MSPNAPATSDDFREQLSAWHDGALPDEASRFVIKRLLQDDALRAEVGRWQVIGDALRRQPQQPFAGDLSGRVAAAVEALATPEPRPSATSWGRGLRWMATAAALAMAAIVAWPADPSPETVTSVAAASTAAPPPSAVGATPRPVPMPLRVPEATPVASVAIAAAVPPLVRAPQPTPEQLAPLPAVDAPSRPWPRSAGGEPAYTVDYRVPATAPPDQ